MELTQELVRDFFDYHEDGYLIWKKLKIKNQVKEGSIAGWISPNKYRYLSILNKGYRASRIIFLWHNGWIPDIVDHENRITLDDRIKNLRASTDTQNSTNRTKSKTSISKYLGVQPYNKSGKWLVCIRHNKVQLKKGSYDTQEQAALIYNRFAVMYHGEFASLNIIQPPMS